MQLGSSTGRRSISTKLVSWKKATATQSVAPDVAPAFPANFSRPWFGNWAWLCWVGSSGAGYGFVWWMRSGRLECTGWSHACVATEEQRQAQINVIMNVFFSSSRMEDLSKHTSQLWQIKRPQFCKKSNLPLCNLHGPRHVPQTRKVSYEDDAHW